MPDTSKVVMDRAHTVARLVAAANGAGIRAGGTDVVAGWRDDTSRNALARCAEDGVPTAAASPLACGTPVHTPDRAEMKFV